MKYFTLASDTLLRMPGIRVRVGALHSHCIELSKILDKAEAPVLLFDEEEQGCHW